jgi:protein-S-isoprenylcysteine O-methyltransferase Ste14
LWLLHLVLVTLPVVFEPSLHALLLPRARFLVTCGLTQPLQDASRTQTVSALRQNIWKDENNMNKLVPQALLSYLIGAVILGLLLFVPAWTLNYWQAWVFILVFTTSVNAIGVYLSIKDPALLERRKKVGPAAEQNVAQRIIMSLALIGILALLIFCALDHRFAWSPVPSSISLLGDMLVALGLLVNLLVFRENSFGGSTVQTFDDQKVISTGPYAIVRHPMYVGVLIMMTGVSLALDSWIGLAFLAIALPALIWRILDEEKLLKKDLSGYIEYTQKVRHRLVPYIW